MKLYYLKTFFLIGVLFFSCSKKSISNNDIKPVSNLNLIATVAVDSSGNVSFIATADNAVSFEYDFGDGVFQTVPSGITNHIYSASGTYSVNVLAKNSIGNTINKTLSVTVTRALRLVWADEFDVAGVPNSSKWGYDIGTGSGGWGNNESQYYTNRIENAVIANGLLKINAIKESYNGSAYTSARLLTKDKFSFKYGKIEVRAKLPEGIGTWPAIWMLGSNISTVSWPACGEIDIMEHRGYELNKIFTTVHYPGHSGSGGVGSNVMITDASTTFHVYGAIWDAGSIQFTIDNQVVYSFTNNSSLPFNQDFFIILNFAMGGTFGGSIDPNFSNASMDIDYVRVYN